MDFSFTEDQEAVRELTARILANRMPLERLREMRVDREHLDRRTWGEMANAGLVGIGLPEEFGGAGLGFLEIALVLEQVGRHVAPVPYYATVALGADAVAHLGTDTQRHEILPALASGDLVMTAALAEAGSPEGPSRAVARRNSGVWRLHGRRDFVPSGLDAGQILIPAQTGRGPAVFIVDAQDPAVDIQRQDVTSEIPEARLAFDGAIGRYLTDATGLAWMIERATAALCAVAIGVCDEAVQLTTRYTNTREQFGRPIATFQAVGQRAADAYIDAEAVRLTAWQAIWRLAEGLPATAQVATAKFWAAEGGQRVVAAAQHLHGAIGVDREYPLHRYFLWAKWIQLHLGGASQQLRAMGRLLANDSPMS